MVMVGKLSTRSLHAVRNSQLTVGHILNADENSELHERQQPRHTGEGVRGSQKRQAHSAEGRLNDDERKLQVARAGKECGGRYVFRYINPIHVGLVTSEFASDYYND